MASFLVSACASLPRDGERHPESRHMGRAGVVSRDAVSKLDTSPQPSQMVATVFERPNNRRCSSVSEPLYRQASSRS